MMTFNHCSVEVFSIFISWINIPICLKLNKHFNLFEAGKIFIFTKAGLIFIFVRSWILCFLQIQLQTNRNIYEIYFRL